jgi:hypothetical protein
LPESGDPGQKQASNGKAFVDEAAKEISPGETYAWNGKLKLKSQSERDGGKKESGVVSAPFENKRVTENNARLGRQWP